MHILSGFTEIGLPIICVFAGLLVGAAIVFFVPFFKGKRDQNKRHEKTGQYEDPIRKA